MSDRAVSQTLGYVLTLAISALLVTGLVVAGSNFVAEQREQVIDRELQVISEQVAAQVEQADRLVEASGGSDGPAELMINRSAPPRVVGTTYNMELLSGPPRQLEVTTTDPEITVTVNLTIQNDVDTTGFAKGGVVVVSWDDDDEVLVIDNE